MMIVVSYILWSLWLVQSFNQFVSFKHNQKAHQIIRISPNYVYNLDSKEYKFDSKLSINSVESQNPLSVAYAQFNPTEPIYIQNVSLPLFPYKSQNTSNIPQSEYNALRDLFYSTAGDSWIWRVNELTYSRWNFTGFHNPCVERWQGLTCACTELNVTTTSNGSNSTDCTINSLILEDFNLVGSVPQSISNLTNLIWLQIDHNKLHSSLPTSISTLTKLIVLDFAYNNLTGTVPNEFSTLNKLQHFLLDSNGFNGTLPEGYRNMTDLLRLTLSQNKVTGTLPYVYGYFQKLRQLDIFSNDLHGTIPHSFGQLPDLRLLNIFDNRLTGSLPAVLSNITKLDQLNVFENQLNGKISSQLATLSNLHSLNVFANKFTGLIPPELGSMQSLLILNLFDNLLTGTIPIELGNLSHILRLDLCTNLLSSTLPQELGNLTTLLELYINNNYVYSTIPQSYAQFTRIFVLYFQSNALTGTLLNEFGTKYRNLTELDCSGNRLTSTIPLSFGNLHSLTELALYDNLLTQSIPTTLTACTKLNIIYLSNNILSGTVPREIGNWHLVTDLYLYSNKLSGSLPLSLLKMTSLRILFVQSNLLTGDLSLVLNATQQSGLQHVDVSDNYFTGPLPSSLFSISPLVSVAMVSNCITGSIPMEICSLSLLSVLALDGLATADKCREQIFPRVKGSSAYGLENKLKGGIPSCLFALPSLQTLHLSGNGLTGTLRSDIILSSTLNDLSLSHNLLSGTIPLVVQQREWVNLDLSYNRITGTLSDNYTMPNNNNSNALSLQDNRLSGVIPHSLKYTQDISILSGNLFSCNVYRSDLPEHDTDNDKYLCGSDSFNRSLIFYGAILFFVLCVRVSIWYSGRYHIAHATSEDKNDSVSKTTLYVIIVRWFRWLKQLVHKIVLWNGVYHQEYITNIEHNHYNIQSNSNVLAFGHITHALRTAAIILMCTVCFCFLPVYIVLTYYFKTYTYEYAWIFSAAFLSGSTPSLTLFVCFTLFTVLLFNVFDKTLYFGRMYTDSRGRVVRDSTSQAGRLSSRSFTNSNSHDNTCKPLSSQNANEKQNIDNDSFGSHTNNISHIRTVEPAQSIDSTTSSSTNNTNTINTHKIHYALCSIIFLINTIAVLSANVLFVYITLYYNETILIFAQIGIALFKLTWSDVAVRGMIRIGSNFVNQPRAVNVFNKHDDIHTVDTTESAKHSRFTVGDVNKGTMRSSLFFENVFNRATFTSRNVNTNNNKNTTRNNNTINTSNRTRNDTLASNFDELERSTSSAVVTSPLQRGVNESSDSNTNTTNNLTPQTQYETTYLTFQIVLSLINNIAIPFFATMCISTDCFYSLFVTPPLVNASYTVTQCALYYLQVDHVVRCVEEVAFVHDTTYLPPFIYSYQCSSAFVTNYGAMYVYMFAVILFLNPAVTLSIKECSKYCVEGGKWHRLLTSLLPTVLRPVATQFPDIVPLLFDRDGFTVRIARNIAILVTFGVVFPPLAVVVCTSIISYTFYEQLLIGRFLYTVYTTQSNELYTSYLRVVETQCRDVSKPLNHLYWILAPFSILFFSCFLFDILGDEVGLLASIWIIVVMSFMPFAIYAVFRLYRVYKPIKQHDSNSASVVVTIFNHLSLYRASSIEMSSSFSGRSTDFSITAQSPVSNAGVRSGGPLQGGVVNKTPPNSSTIAVRSVHEDDVEENEVTSDVVVAEEVVSSPDDKSDNY